MISLDTLKRIKYKLKALTHHFIHLILVKIEKIRKIRMLSLRLEIDLN
jgi:hypothetical protein